MKLTPMARLIAKLSAGALMTTALTACVIAPARYHAGYPGPVVVEAAPVVVAPAPPVVVVRPAVPYGGYRHPYPSRYPYYHR